MQGIVGGDARSTPGRALSRRTRFSGLGLALVVALAGAAGADTLRVQGDTLRGHVVDLTPDGVSFEPVYGSGSIVVPWADVQEIRTEAPMAIMHGEQGEARGRVLGLEEGRIVVGDDPSTAERIEVSTLFRAYPEDELDGSVYEELQSRFRYWSASLDAGVAYTDSTSDNSSAFTGLRIERRRSPTRLLFEGNFRYATEKQKGEPRTVTENIATGLLRGEYDLTDRLFTFASNRATYDEDKSLSLRLEPRGGLGARILNRKDLTFFTDVGVAWIYEDYFGSAPIPGQEPLTRSRGTDNFWAVAFGTDFMWKMPIGLVFRASGDYLPAVDAWTSDYLLRGDTSLEVPLIKWLSFKLRALDEYDNSPAEGTDRNRFTFTGLLSVNF